MSEDDRPEIPEEPEPPETHEATGAPAPEVADPDEGLTAEERAMLESLSTGTGSADEITDRPGAPEQAAPTESAAEETPVEPEEKIEEAEGDELTPEEKTLLARLSAEAVGEASAAAETPQAEVEPEAPSEPAEPAAAETELTAEEEKVREQARSESERVSREELPAMFEQPGEAATEVEASTGAERDEPVIAEVLDEPEVEAEASPEEAPVGEAAAPAKPPGKLSRILAMPFDLINRPFRWIPPVWRMGLGLCGVLLLITLLLVVLVRMVFES